MSRSRTSASYVQSNGRISTRAFPMGASRCCSGWNSNSDAMPSHSTLETRHLPAALWFQRDVGPHTRGSHVSPHRARRRLVRDHRAEHAGAAAAGRSVPTPPPAGLPQKPLPGSGPGPEAPSSPTSPPRRRIPHDGQAAFPAVPAFRTVCSVPGRRWSPPARNARDAGNAGRLSCGNGTSSLRS